MLNSKRTLVTLHFVSEPQSRLLLVPSNKEVPLPPPLPAMRWRGQLFTSFYDA